MFSGMQQVQILCAGICKSQPVCNLIIGRPGFGFVRIEFSASIIEVFVDCDETWKPASGPKVFHFEDFVAAKIALGPLTVGTSGLKISTKERLVSSVIRKRRRRFSPTEQGHLESLIRP
jgi:hypothetical protein